MALAMRVCRYMPVSVYAESLFDARLFWLEKNRIPGLFCFLMDVNITGFIFSMRYCCFYFINCTVGIYFFIS